MFLELGLSIDMLLVLGILILTALLFVTDIVRVDLVAILVLTILGVTKILTPEQLFSGFSSEAVITLIAIMIISAGLERSGISLKAARWMLDVGHNNPTRLNMLIMLTSGFLASFMRSLGTVALFLPIITRITGRTGISKSYFLMPMAFCTLLGGTLTMIGAGPLILVNSLLKNAYSYISYEQTVSLEQFELFAVFPIGLMLLFAGVIYLTIVSFLFKDKKTKRTTIGMTKEYFKKTYGKGGELFEVKVQNSSDLVDTTLKSLELNFPPGLSTIAVKQGKNFHYPPLRRTIFKGDDLLAIMGPKDEVTKFCQEHKLKLYAKLNVFDEELHPVRAGLSEAVIPPSSSFIGQEIRELHMRRNHELHVLGVCRGGTTYNGEGINDLVLKPGDTLGMFSKWEALAEFQKNPDFFVLTSAFPKEKNNIKKMPHATFAFLLGILLVLFADIPSSVSLLIAAITMIVTGVMNADEAYKAISWRTIFLLAGLIPLGLAMQTTGFAEWIIDIFYFSNYELPGFYILLCLVVISTIMALLISNVGATIVIVPIAINLALVVGADPRIYALAVALATANTFIIPTHQVNALVAGPGDYSIKDFLKVGCGMTLIFWLVLMVGLKLTFGLDYGF